MLREDYGGSSAHTCLGELVGEAERYRAARHGAGLARFDAQLVDDVHEGQARAKSLQRGAGDGERTPNGDGRCTKVARHGMRVPRTHREGKQEPLWAAPHQLLLHVARQQPDARSQHLRDRPRHKH